ncbi:activin receptor type-2A-like isoform X2 [Phymastichus coffea]|uniref:activin receptor type-2A-like isoform X2 n=1 Tax=Phymastichus coffea TaxID=108790 RepID=UPI00273B0877|nr:activin receptor type-2A-like isoform X2 [Phymastichus coffea]
MKFESVLLFVKTAIIIFKGYRGEEFIYCESYNAATCDKSNKKDCFTQEKCGSITSDQHNHCFTLWEYNFGTDISEVQMKGCFLNNKDCYEKSHCVVKNKESTKQLYFCCCNGQMCNKNITYTNMIIKKQDTISINDKKKIIKVFLTESQFQILVPMLATLFFLIVVVIVISCLLYQRSKLDKIKVSKSEFDQNQIQLPTIVTQDPSLRQLEHENETSDQSEIKLSNVLTITTKLIKKKASGRFGAIWTGQRSNVFRLPGMDHENLLQFIGACHVGDSLKSEFWLLTEYCEKGSLYDYLRENTVTWEELTNITLCIVRGLKHLHEEQRDPIGNHKPVVAHRDFKSKNVLITGSNPIRVCIGDFNMALVIENDGSCVSRCGRVGTLRYMAPEILDGAINFTKNAILSIDMYAFALVLWELMSRCVIDENPVSDYQLPFQTEVGLMPKLSEMQDCVVCKRLRPRINEIWSSRSDLAVIRNIVEECWDHDPDGRISSSTAMERITDLITNNF